MYSVLCFVLQQENHISCWHFVLFWYICIFFNSCFCYWNASLTVMTNGFHHWWSRLKNMCLWILAHTCAPSLSASPKRFKRYCTLNSISFVESSTCRIMTNGYINTCTIWSQLLWYYSGEKPESIWQIT